jgi:hypothetical protein
VKHRTELYLPVQVADSRPRVNFGLVGTSSPNAYWNITQENGRSITARDEPGRKAHLSVLFLIFDGLASSKPFMLRRN